MKELVLTGMEDYWPQDERNALFLGPWCFAYNHKYKFWDQKKFTLASSPWRTPQDLLNANRYIDSLIDRIIPSFSSLMNEFHRVNYSDTFWKTYSIVWLTHWLGIVYDRYSRLIHLGQDVKEKLSVNVLEEYDLPVKDLWDYMNLSTSTHHYNLLLLSQIIENATFDFLSPVKHRMTADFLSHQITHLKSKRITALKVILEKKTRSLKLTFRSLLVDSLKSDIYIGTIYGLSIFDKLFFQLRNKPHLDISRKDLFTTPFQGDRQLFVSIPFVFHAENEFELIATKILTHHVPIALLALYEDDASTKNRTQVWIGNDIYHSEQDAYRIARIREQGGSWISAQHGGGYGQFYSFPVGKIEYETSDGFVTWGWRDKHVYDSRYYPLPSPLLSKLPSHKETKNALFLVGTMLPAYHYRFHSFLMPEDLLNYMENTKAFIRRLSPEIRTTVAYRPYMHSFGTNHVEFYEDILPKDQFYLQGSLIKQFKSCRLAVIDHMATTFMQAFVMNTPTILFWDPAHFAVTAEAAPFFDTLRAAGILHDTPEEAAKKVSEIWHHVPAWWQQPEVQKAKNDFCRQFAWGDKNWKKMWLEFIRSHGSCGKIRSKNDTLIN